MTVGCNIGCHGNQISQNILPGEKCPGEKKLYTCPKEVHLSQFTGGKLPGRKKVEHLKSDDSALFSQLRRRRRRPLLICKYAHDYCHIYYLKAKINDSRGNKAEMFAKLALQIQRHVQKSGTRKIINAQVLNDIIRGKLNGYELQLLLEKVGTNLDAPELAEILEFIRKDEAGFNQWLSQSRHTQRSVIETRESLPRSIGMMKQTNLKITTNSVAKLPKEIGQLVHLKWLIIDMPLLKNLPNEIGKCESLEHLHISNTAMKQMPMAIQWLKNLKDLKLVNNRLLQSIPQTIGSLRQLQQLEIINSPEIVVVPNSLYSARKLRLLTLDQLGVTKLPKGTGIWYNTMETLRLSRLNNMQGVPLIVFKLKKLTTLHLVAMRNIDRIPVEIRQLVNLETLDISHTPIRELVKEVGALPKLKLLIIGLNHVMLFLPPYITSKIKKYGGSLEIQVTLTRQEYTDWIKYEAKDSDFTADDIETKFKDMWLHYLTMVLADVYDTKLDSDGIPVFYTEANDLLNELVEQYEQSLVANDLPLTPEAHDDFFLLLDEWVDNDEYRPMSEEDMEKLNEERWFESERGQQVMAMFEKPWPPLYWVYGRKNNLAQRYANAIESIETEDLSSVIAIEFRTERDSHVFSDELIESYISAINETLAAIHGEQAIVQ